MIGTFVKGFVTGALAERNKAVIIEVGLGFAKGLIQDYYSSGKNTNGSNGSSTKSITKHDTTDRVARSEF
jgi:hypothetical protein